MILYDNENLGPSMTTMATAAMATAAVSTTTTASITTTAASAAYWDYQFDEFESSESTCK